MTVKEAIEKIRKDIIVFYRLKGYKTTTIEAIETVLTELENKDKIMEEKMIILGGKRVCGKTTELIKMSATNRIPIVVLNHRRREEIEHMAKQKGMEIPKPIIYKNSIERVGRKLNEILIDDIEDILNDMFFPSKIVAMTTSASFMPLINNREVIK